MANGNIIRRHPGTAPGHVGREVRRCAFTGYRVQKLPFASEADEAAVDFKGRLHATIEALIWQGYSHFISGGATGADMYAAEAVLALRSAYPWIGLELALPCDGQDASWPVDLRRRYARMLDEADMITYTGHRYTPICMMARNHYLVNNADLLLAIYDGQPGGTAMTVGYAEKLGVPVLTLAPILTVGMPQETPALVRYGG